MNIDSGLLQFKSVAIEEGLRLKRFRAGSKGMAKPFRHEYSHIKLVLTTGDNTDKSIKSVKSIKSETEPVETEVKKTELKEVKSTKLKVKNATKEPKAEK